MLPVRAKWKKIIVVCKYIYTPLILACIIFYVFQNSALLTDLFSKSRPVFLISAVLLWASLHLLAPLSPQLILRSLGYSLPYKELLKIYISRLPARYIPGGVWHTVGRLADYHSSGVTKRHLSFLAFFDTLFPIPVTLCIGGTLLWIWSPGTQTDSLVMTCSIFSCIVLLSPFFIFKWVTIVNNAQIKATLLYLYMLLLAFIFWFLAATSFLFYFHSVAIPESSQHSIFAVAGAYIFAWGAGYIAIFAPQGIGVFEVVAGKLINLPMSLGSSVAFLAGFRLIALMADFIIYSLYNLFITAKK